MSRLSDQLLLQLLAAGLPEPEREYPFAPQVDGKPVRKWRFDLAYPAGSPALAPGSPPVAIEVDGGTYAGGRHTRGPGHAQDALKRNVAQALGWRVVVLTDRDRWKGRAALAVRAALGDQAALGELMLLDRDS